MQYIFKTKHLPISARKVRLIASFFDHKELIAAQEMLKIRQEKAAKLIFRSLLSAGAALKNRGAQEEDLSIVRIRVDEGPRLKRRLIKPRGRADLIKKRRSHLTVILKDKRKKSARGRSASGGKQVDQKEKI